MELNRAFCIVRYTRNVINTKLQTPDLTTLFETKQKSSERRSVLANCMYEIQPDFGSYVLDYALLRKN